MGWLGGGHTRKPNAVAGAVLDEEPKKQTTEGTYVDLT